MGVAASVDGLDGRLGGIHGADRYSNPTLAALAKKVRPGDGDGVIVQPQAGSSKNVSVVPGRWVVVLEAGGTPTFWSYDCELLRTMFVAIRNVCPGAQLVWEPSGDGDNEQRVGPPAAPQRD